MTGKTTFLALFIVGLLVCPAAADSFSVTAPSSTIWALPGGSVTIPISVSGIGSFNAVELGVQYDPNISQTSSGLMTLGSALSGWWWDPQVTMTHDSTYGYYAAVGLASNAEPWDITNPSGTTILNATLQVLPSATIGSSGAVSVVNYKPYGDNLNFAMTGTSVINVIEAAEWKNNISGSSSVADNWKGPVPNGDGVGAVLGTAVNTTGATVTLDQPTTLGWLRISPSSGGSYTVSGNVTNSLTMSNNGSVASITSTAGSNTINAPLSFTNSLGVTVGTTDPGSSNQRLSVSGAVTGTGSLTKDGLGLLALGETLTMTNSGNVFVNSGSMTARAILDIGGTLTVSNSARVATNYLRAQKLVLSPGSTVVLGGVASSGGDAASDAMPSGFASLGAGLAAAPSAVVPEPGTFALLIIGALCLPPLAWRRWRRR